MLILILARSVALRFISMSAGLYADHGLEQRCVNRVGFNLAEAKRPISFSNRLAVAPTDVRKSFRDRGVPREFRYAIDNSRFSGVPKNPAEFLFKIFKERRRDARPLRTYPRWLRNRIQKGYAASGHIVHFKPIWTP